MVYKGNNLVKRNRDYVTDNNEFLNRKNAAIHALGCGQISSDIPILLSTHLRKNL
jgi:hypothetical protein